MSTFDKAGRKFDAGKPRASLFPLGVQRQIIAVLEYDAQKYGDNNWQNLTGGRARYYDATCRHLDAWWHGERQDPESGLPHLAHAVCSLLFLLWQDNQEDQA